MVGHVPDRLREGLREALIAVGTQDSARLVASMKTMDVLLPRADLKLIERATVQVFDRFGGMSMDELRGIDPEEMTRFGLQFRDLMVDLPFQLPDNLLMLGLNRHLVGYLHRAGPRLQHLEHHQPLRRQTGGRGRALPPRQCWPRWESWRIALALPGRADRVLAMAERGD